MIRRILGIILLLIGLSGIALGIVGARVSRDMLQTLSDGTKAGLDLAIDSLQTVSDSLTLARQTIADVNTSLVTVQTTATDVAVSLEASQPMVAEVAAIAGQDLPRSVETIQSAIPNAAQAAEAIDSTLTTLNRFKIDTTILGFPIQYDLGIDYNPDVPFGESVLAIGRSLDDMPIRLRNLETALEDTAVNLQTISEDMRSLSTDLEGINGRLLDFDPLITDYIRIVTETDDNLRLIRGQIDQQVSSAQFVITLGMVWLVVSQLVPLYLGLDLLTDGRLFRRSQPTTNEEQSPS
ncbi:MAG: hypothetical protein KBE23_16990 [Chloroflexi bacterium]|nr:hypothetical protein [Chloroflexota bacterium]MBP7044450.1 hypothetical protein [Chloroflexota bacterium]